MTKPGIAIFITYVRLRLCSSFRPSSFSMLYSPRRIIRKYSQLKLNIVTGGGGGGGVKAR